MPSTITAAIEFLVIGLGLAIVRWRLAAAIRVARFARQRGFSRLASTEWAITALVHAAIYWWHARMGA